MGFDPNGRSSPGKCSEPRPRGGFCRVTSLATPPRLVLSLSKGRGLRAFSRTFREISEAERGWTSRLAERTTINTGQIGITLEGSLRRRIVSVHHNLLPLDRQIQRLGGGLPNPPRTIVLC